MVKFRRILNGLASSYVRIRGEFEDSFYASVCKTQVGFPHRLGLLLYVRVRACEMLDKGKPAILLAGFHGGGVRDYAWAGEAGNGGRGGAAPPGSGFLATVPIPYPSTPLRASGLGYV